MVVQPNSPAKSNSGKQKMNNKGSRRGRQRRRSDNGNQSTQQRKYKLS